LLICLPVMVLAHERFVTHTPRWPLNEEFFKTLLFKGKEIKILSAQEYGQMEAEKRLTGYEAKEGENITVGGRLVYVEKGKHYSANGMDMTAPEGGGFNVEGGQQVVTKAGETYRLTSYRDQKFYNVDFSPSDMLNIATRVAVIMAGMIFVWFLRVPI